MSDSLSIDSAAPTSRAPRRDRADRQPEYQRDKPDPSPIEITTEVDPSAALADGARQLQQQDKQVRDSRARETAAVQRAQAAEAELARAQANQFTDRQAVVAQALEAAKAEQNAAKTAKRAARETGDIDAEIAADELLGAATFRASQAASELDALKAATPPQGQRPPARAQPTGDIYTPEARRWLDDHPMYFKDPVYKGTAIEMHNEALRAGLADGSQPYVDYIDGRLNELFGEGHGREPVQHDGARGHEMSGRRPGAGDGVPPSRGNGGANGGNGGRRAVQTVLHKSPIYVTPKPGGGMKVSFHDAEQLRDFEEGAKTCHMSLEDYVADHIAITEERAAGGTGDMIVGEGAKFE